MGIKLVILATSGAPTDIMVNFLDDAGFPPTTVLIEPAQSRSTMLRRRARRLGWRKVLGQLLFLMLVPPVLRRKSAVRLGAIRKDHGLRLDPLSPERVRPIPSVNAGETRRLLYELKADVVVLSGTRILQPETLEAARGPVLNIHAGVTPAFRGVHGGYWALRTGRAHEFGATVHLVDSGVDTGGVLELVTPSPQPEDNFVTYPVLQLAAALPALVDVLTGLEQGKGLPDLVPTNGSGRQWYHPTISQYLTGIRQGVR